MLIINAIPDAPIAGLENMFVYYVVRVDADHVRPAGSPLAAQNAEPIASRTRRGQLHLPGAGRGDHDPREARGVKPGRSRRGAQRFGAALERRRAERAAGRPVRDPGAPLRTRRRSLRRSATLPRRGSASRRSTGRSLGLETRLAQRPTTSCRSTSPARSPSTSRTTSSRRSSARRPCSCRVRTSR